MNNNEIYEAALKTPASGLRKTLHAIWLFFGLGTLIAFAWAEPFSGMLFRMAESAGIPAAFLQYLCVPLVMALRAVVLVEAVGYVYHRFFQHVGFFTRRAHLFRRNQKYHWIHHMVIYPIGRLYRRAVEYVPAEDGLGLSWAIPALAASGLFLLFHGINLGSIVFMAALLFYAKCVVDKTHSRFHEVNHPWAGKPYFKWLEDIHVLHHWDQRKNFTIVHPLMDQLFGTYLNPAKHQEELQRALADDDLTVSDVINWRYLLVEASPAEYAAFISDARKRSRSLRKVALLQRLFQDRLSAQPNDSTAADLLQRTKNLIRACGKDPAQLT